MGRFRFTDIRHLGNHCEKWPSEPRQQWCFLHIKDSQGTLIMHWWIQLLFPHILVKCLAHVRSWRYHSEQDKTRPLHPCCLPSRREADTRQGNRQSTRELQAVISLMKRTKEKRDMEEQYSRGAAGLPWPGGQNQSPEEPGSLSSCYISWSPLIPSHFPPTLGTRDGDTNEERGELIFQYSLTSLDKARQKGNMGMSTSTGRVESGVERPWEVVSNWKG